ncbi:L-type lectin-like domain-containing protein [Termitomyces sp. J132]|nr:L-type lectin-like domain-containing protein [Termitomyces sp. J132]
MLSRFVSVFSVSVIVFGSLSGFVHAAVEETDKLRIGNETIDRDLGFATMALQLDLRFATVQLRTHSIYAPYIDQDLQNRWWDFGADAYVNTNKHIRLTQNRPSQMGWLWSRLALTAVNFVVEVEFKVSGDSSHLFGDGLAIWLTRERKIEGPVFGNKDNFEVRRTNFFPHITAMLGDGKTPYDQDNDGDANSIGACSANFRRTNVATKLKVAYIKGKFLDVKLQHKAWDEWTDCFHVKNITLPLNPFLGFTAMTGDVSDAHDIITVTTYSAILIPPEPTKQKKSIFSSSSSSSGSGSWFGFFFKLLLFIGVCIGGYHGYQEYQRRQRAYGGGNFGLGGIGRGGGGFGGFGGGSYSGNKRAFK